MKQDEKDLLIIFESFAYKLEDLSYKIVRDEDYKYIITIPDVGLVDFYTKSNMLYFRANKSWKQDGLEYFKNIVDFFE
jgi:hypothetical protein